MATLATAAHRHQREMKALSMSQARTAATTMLAIPNQRTWRYQEKRVGPQVADHVEGDQDASAPQVDGVLDVQVADVGVDRPPDDGVHEHAGHRRPEEREPRAACRRRSGGSRAPTATGTSTGSTPKAMAR